MSASAADGAALHEIQQELTDMLSLTRHKLTRQLSQWKSRLDDNRRLTSAHLAAAPPQWPSPTAAASEPMLYPRASSLHGSPPAPMPPSPAPSPLAASTDYDLVRRFLSRLDERKAARQQHQHHRQHNQHRQSQHSYQHQPHHHQRQRLVREYAPQPEQDPAPLRRAVSEAPHALRTDERNDSFWSAPAAQPAAAPPRRAQSPKSFITGEQMFGGGSPSYGPPAEAAAPLPFPEGPAAAAAVVATPTGSQVTRFSQPVLAEPVPTVVRTPSSAPSPDRVLELQELRWKYEKEVQMREYLEASRGRLEAELGDLRRKQSLTQEQETKAAALSSRLRAAEEQLSQEARNRQQLEQESRRSRHEMTVQRARVEQALHQLADLASQVGALGGPEAHGSASVLTERVRAAVRNVHELLGANPPTAVSQPPPAAAKPSRRSVSFVDDPVSRLHADAQSFLPSPSVAADVGLSPSTTAASSSRVIGVDPVLLQEMMASR